MIGAVAAAASSFSRCERGTNRRPSVRGKNELSDEFFGLKSILGLVGCCSDSASAFFPDSGVAVTSDVVSTVVDAVSVLFDSGV